MNATRDDQQGSVLIIAIIAMLILGILSISFALLARVEVAIGVNYKSQAQAEALAEAGLERARDLVRSADAEPCGFTRWTDSASNSYGCGSYVSPPTETLGPGSYTFVIDNDCPTLVPDTPKLKDKQCGGAGVTQPYPTSGVNRDANQIAVVTAWATTSSGQGRARVRAILGIDNPWRHVCSSSSQDNPPGYCNEPANRNGNPTITPADPNEYPGGPAAYDDLPRPQLGCSEIDPSLHGGVGNIALCAGLPSPNSFINYVPGTGYPNSTGARLVVTGDRTKANCDGGGRPYQGFFDCALSTPCPSAICSPARPACVKPGDLRSGANYIEATVPGVTCAANVPPATGMVFTSDLDWPVDYGNSDPTGLKTPVYVMGGSFTIQSHNLRGIVVVEGLGDPQVCPSSKDVWHKNGSKIWTDSTLYGYPLAYLVFDPAMAIANAPQPTANPLNPQPTCMDMGSASGTEIHGIIYSGGNVEFNPVAVDGGVVAFQIQTQSSSAIYGYNELYGDAAPPAGFPVGQGNQVVIVKKSFLVCGNYAAGSGTACQ